MSDSKFIKSSSEIILDVLTKADSGLCLENRVLRVLADLALIVSLPIPVVVYQSDHLILLYLCSLL